MSDLIHSQNKISTYVKGKSREIHISPILLEPNHDSSFYWLRLASQNQHQIWFSEGKKKKNSCHQQVFKAFNISSPSLYNPKQISLNNWMPHSAHMGKKFNPTNRR